MQLGLEPRDGVVSCVGYLRQWPEACGNGRGADLKRVSETLRGRRGQIMRAN
jgi:hypothetical protein